MAAYDLSSLFSQLSLGTTTLSGLKEEDPKVKIWLVNKAISLEIASELDSEVHQVSVELYERADLENSDYDLEKYTAIRFTRLNGEEHTLWAITQKITTFVQTIETFTGEKLEGPTFEDTIWRATEAVENKLVLDRLINNSREFQKHTRIPTDANQIAQIIALDPAKKAEVVAHAKGTRPIIHERTYQLIEDFLAEKRRNGSEIEKSLYAGMDCHGMIDRILGKRPISFVGGSDSCKLRNGERGRGRFETIGTDEEQEPLTLKNYMSYDEIRISALVGVSVPTHFINSGSRANRAMPGVEGTFEEKGIYVGLVGARFERPNQMEWRDMLITPEQNTIENGYGVDADPANPKTQALSLWAKLYGQSHFPTYKEAMEDVEGRYIKTRCGLFNKEVFKARLKLSIIPFLHDANLRAQQQGKQAYVHAVGLGLGVWQICQEQDRLMLEAYAELLPQMDLSHISDIDFSWFKDSSCGGVKDGGIIQAGDHPITLHFSKRDPAAKLTGENAGKLLVAMYAWDGNAFPGNEYWGGGLACSGDPAAACCSTIPELQNPEINEYLSSKSVLITPGLKDDGVPSSLPTKESSKPREEKCILQ